MKKTWLISIIFAVILSVFIPTAAVEAAPTFKDVPKNFWAAKQIYRFADSKVINGYEDGTFRPNQNITRAQAAVILANVLGLDTKNPPAVNYKDIHKNNNAYNAIAAITNSGIMSGNNGVFQPTKPLTRAEMAIILTKAFKLEGNQTASFKDVSKGSFAYQYIDAIFANKITSGYTDNTFRPNVPTTRAQFAVFLANALDKKQFVAQILKTAYLNEQNIQSYEYKGSMNFGITMPESIQSTPEDAVIAEMLNNIKIDISGVYQKTPMRMEANVDVTLSGEIQTKMSIPIVITEEKMWIKIPNSPLLPLPEEMAGKFVEFDLEELQALSGQPSGTIDTNLQTEFALAISNLFIDQFANGFFTTVGKDAIAIPSNINAKHVIKFELTKENLQPFISQLTKGFLPKYFELIQDPKYLGTDGLSEEDKEIINKELASVNIDEIVKAVNEVVTINKFETFTVINQNDYLVYSLLNFDVNFAMDDETFGLKLNIDQEKSNINGDVKFLIGTPTSNDIIPFEELMYMEESQTLN